MFGKTYLIFLLGTIFWPYTTFNLKNAKIYFKLWPTGKNASKNNRLKETIHLFNLRHIFKLIEKPNISHSHIFSFFYLIHGRIPYWHIITYFNTEVALILLAKITKTIKIKIKWTFLDFFIICSKQALTKKKFDSTCRLFLFVWINFFGFSNFWQDLIFDLHVSFSKHFSIVLVHR